MKKFAIILTLAATLVSKSAFAQESMGSGAAAGKTYSNSTFAWAIGAGMLVAVGLVVGFTVAGSTGSESSFSH
jgi:hypothetical protein